MVGAGFAYWEMPPPGCVFTGRAEDAQPCLVRRGA